MKKKERKQEFQRVISSVLSKMQNFFLNVNQKTLVFSQEFDYWIQQLIINFSTTTMALLEYFMLLYVRVTLFE